MNSILHQVQVPLRFVPEGGHLLVFTLDGKQSKFTGVKSIVVFEDDPEKAIKRYLFTSLLPSFHTRMASYLFD